MWIARHLIQDSKIEFILHIFNLFQSLKTKNEFGVEPIDRQMDPEQSGFNSAYHQRLTSIINEAIRNNYI